MAETERKRLNFIVDKVFLGYDEKENPQIEPLFVNHFEILQIGSDIFLDAGIITPEEIMGMQPASGGGPTKATFNVLYRIAMSPQTFANLYQKAALLFEAMKTTFDQMKDTFVIERPHVSSSEKP